MSASARRSRIPLQPTPLFGREDDLRTACRQLERSSVRLLTITGTGGIGKTRLALAVAARLEERFAAGAWFVDLAGLSEANLVPVAIARALGMRIGGERPELESLSTHLHGQHLLLLLDNFEHILTAAPLLAELLSTCPSLKILVTSREPLRLRWEHVFPLMPLALPDLQHLPTPHKLALNPAVALFVARAQAIQPDFKLSGENAPTVAAICVRLDGLPLALELAATRISTLSPQTLLARLTSRLPLLQWQASDLPARQHTLRATIDWSYELLSPFEKILLRRLAVFAGDWSLDAATAIAIAVPTTPLSSGGIAEVLDGVSALVDKGLVQPQGRDKDDAPHFRLLETVREYADEKLSESGEADDIRLRHAQWYLALAEKAGPHWSGPGERAWLSRLEHARDNLRAALAWSIERGQVEIEARLCAALWMMWLRTNLAEGQRAMEEVLTRTQSISPQLRARLLTGAASLALPLGQHERAEALYTQALALQHSLGDALGEAYSMNLLGMVAIEQGNLRQATERLEESVAGFRAIAYTHGIAFALDNLGRVMIYQEQNERAQALLTEALALWQELGNMQGCAETLSDLALLATQQGDYMQALTRYHEALTRLQELGNEHLIAWCIETLATIAIALQQSKVAVELLGMAEALRTRIGAPRRLVDRASYERTLNAARDTLGIEKFTSARMTGRSIPATQVSETALSRVQELQQQIKEVQNARINSAKRANNLLSARELEILRLVAEGLPNKAIGSRLTISEHTVKYHITSILNKLGAGTRAQAIAYASARGILREIER